MTIKLDVPRRFPRALQQLLKEPNPPTWLKVLRKKQLSQRQRWTEEGTPFPVGQKKIYLPNFTVQFNRTPFLSPRWASFSVPLWFNKLDIRDYLWHLYKVRIHSVRSYVLPSSVQPKPNQIPGKRKMYRPQNKKKMTVELDRPFVWPEVPPLKELEEAFNTETIRRVNKLQMERAIGTLDDVLKKEEREQLRSRAQRLLKGEEKWEGGESARLPSNAPLTLSRVVSAAHR